MDSWARVRRIFEDIVDLQGSDRERRLQQLCGGDAELRTRVERLLSRDESTFGVEIDSHAEVATAPDPSRLRRVGTYELVRVLGSGGMGTVFEARQEQPSRTVALKVLRTLVASESARRRLEYEAEALGRLRHPNVAQIHESGTWRDPDTDEEMPFFALEFVAGARQITDYANARHLGLRERIDLFLPVCDAVHHGHQQGVLHRDLKPGNILVGDDGLPKVIDFGIARATDNADDGRTLRTMTGQVLGTPGYMAPEQIDGDPARIDVRADVYGLGATLYELLTGGPPHDKAGVSLGAFLKQVREVAPTRPSTVTDTAVAVPAELDWVMLRALAAEPAERYDSASALAADLRRFLADEPLVARSPSRSYRLRKFVRRNRATVVAGGIVTLALVAGTIMSLIGWARALDAEEVAEGRREYAEQVANELHHLTELQAEIIEGGRGARNTLLVDVLDRASNRLRRNPPGNDRVAAGLHNAVATAYNSLGVHDRAQEHLDAALARVVDNPALRRTWITTKTNEAKVLQALGKVEESEEIRRAMMRASVEEYGDTHWRTAWGRVQLAIVLSEREQHAEALGLSSVALPVLESDPDVGTGKVVTALSQSAMALHRLGRSEEALGRYERARKLSEDEFGLDDPFTLAIRNSQAVHLLDMKRIPEAQKLFRELWEVHKGVSGPAHPSTLLVAANLALCSERSEEYPQAEAIYREVLETRAAAGAKLAMVDLITRFNLCVSLHRQEIDSKFAQALGELDSLLADAATLMPVNSWRLAVFRHHRGIVLRKQKRYAEAEVEYAAARDVLEDRLGPDHSRTQSNYEETALLFESWGKPDEAKRWRARLKSR